VREPSYRTDAMCQTASSPSVFFLSSVNDHPFIPKPPSTRAPPQYSVIRASRGRITRRKDAEQVPYFCGRCWQKVSSDETHSGRDPSVIMLPTGSRGKEAAPVPVPSLFSFSLGRKSLVGVRGEAEERPEESGSGAASLRGSQQQQQQHTGASAAASQSTHICRRKPHTRAHRRTHTHTQRDCAHPLPDLSIISLTRCDTGGGGRDAMLSCFTLLHSISGSRASALRQQAMTVRYLYREEDRAYT